MDEPDLINARRLLKKFHNFDDGFLRSFEYYQLPTGPFAAKIVLYARDNELPDNQWGTVALMMSDVQCLCGKYDVMFHSRIFYGVRILQFGDLICVDVDGNYASMDGPASLEEVRRDGECYMIGRGLSVEQTS